MDTVVASNAVTGYLARTIRSAARNLGHWVVTTDPTKLDWTPGEPGITKARTILNQVGECVDINRRFAALVRGETPPESEIPTFKDANDAQLQLIDSAADFASAVESRDDSMLGEFFRTGFGPLSGEFLVTIGTANMFYHGGAVNAYQLMYGDEEFRFPPHVE